MTIDEVLKQLEDSVSKKKDIEADIVRLTKERDVLQEEVNDLADKKESLASDLKKEKDKMMLSVKDKDVQVEAKLKDALEALNDANASREKNDSILKENTKLNAMLKAKINELDAQSEQVEKIVKELQTTIKDITEKLGKLI